MNEQLISYEAAKLAHSVNFHKHETEFNCSFMYGSQNTPQLEKFNIRSFTLYDDYCLAPTQSLLQKWLRDKHGISVLVHLDMTLSYVYVINSLHPKASYVGKEINSKHVYSLYEQALEEGLKTALNLIK